MISIICTNLLVLLFFLILLEMFLRKLESGKVNIWKVEPTFSYYEMFTLRPLTSSYLNIDLVPGVTTLRKTPTNPAMGLHVYMLGGSTVAGERNPDDPANSDADTISSHLAAISVSNNYPMIVDNYGVPCYRSNEELAKLIKLLRAGHRPDVVLLYHGFNDTEFAMNGQVCYDLLKPMESAFEKDAVRENAAALLDKIELVRRFRSPAVKSLMTGFLSLPFMRGDGSSEYISIDRVDLKTFEERKLYCVRTYTENAKMVEALGKAYGFQPIFVLQPMIYFKKNRSEQEQKIYQALPESLQKGVPEMYAAIAGEMKWSRNMVVATDIFDGHSDTVYPFDQGHTLSCGNKIIAEYLFNVVTNRLAGCNIE